MNISQQKSEKKVWCVPPYFKDSCLIEYNQSTIFPIFLEDCSPTTWFYKIDLLSGVTVTLEVRVFHLLVKRDMEMFKIKIIA